MKRKKFIVYLVSFFIISFLQSSFAQETETTPENVSVPPSFPGGFGISAGTPGILHFDFIIASKDPSAVDLGLTFSLSLAMPQLLRDDNYDSETGVTREKEDGDTTFWAGQIGIPFFLLKKENMFMAIAPVSGFGYYNVYHIDKKDKKGWWTYAGGVVDFRYDQFFAEAGLCYSRSDDYYTIDVLPDISLLCKVGVIAWFN